MTSHTIVETPAGEIRFDGCTADVFDRWTLTITELGTEDVRREFRTGTWTAVTVFDHRGYPEFSIEPPPRVLAFQPSSTCLVSARDHAQHWRSR